MTHIATAPAKSQSQILVKNNLSVRKKFLETSRIRKIRKILTKLLYSLLSTFRTEKDSSDGIYLKEKGIKAHAVSDHLS